MTLRIAALITVLAALAFPARAQIDDHLKCYKVTDSLNLAAVVDLDSPQFGTEPGCTVSKAKFFCVPATKNVVSATNKTTHSPIAPLPISGPDAGDRICYKIKCPVNPPPPPADQTATDQFGSRTLAKFKASLLCTPAVKGTAYCGDGARNGTDECEGTDLNLQTCQTLGFDHGTLACGLNCEFDTSGCSNVTCGNGVRNGNEQCDGSDLGPGCGGGCLADCRCRWKDNGDNTVSDNQTGLMWVKLTSLDGVPQPYILDADDKWDWKTAIEVASALNGPSNSGVIIPVPGNGLHTDWRLPNVQELETIADLTAPGCGSGSACINSIFGATAADYYWSSTTYANNPGGAFIVSFYHASAGVYDKNNAGCVRAVRGGS